MADLHPCGVCREPVAPRGENKAFPFCSPRCQLVDLSHWLDGNYRLPDAPTDGGSGFSLTPDAQD